VLFKTGISYQLCFYVSFISGTVLLVNKDVHLTYKRRYVCLSVCLSACGQLASRTAGPIKTKLGMGTHVDPGSVLGKVNVKVVWRYLANANKTPYRGPQGPTEFERNKFGATWRMLIKLLTEARKGRENSKKNTVNRGPQGQDNRARAKTIGRAAR